MILTEEHELKCYECKIEIIGISIIITVAFNSWILHFNFMLWLLLIILWYLENLG